MNAEDVLVLTPEDDLNNQNESTGKDQASKSELLETDKNSGHESENVNFVDQNGPIEKDDLLKSDDNGELLESGEINEIKNKENSETKIDENLLNEMKYLFKNTRYFLIKSNNYENVQLAQTKNVWSTPKGNEIKLNKAYKECANVILIFSVAESGRFQGYARLASDCRLDPDLQVNWMLPPTLNPRSLMGVFKIDWITKNDLFFTKTQHLLNSWNENRQVKIGRDGQEIEPHCGESLCRLFELSLPIDPEPKIEEINKNLSYIIKKSKRRHEQLLEDEEKPSKEKRSRSRSSSRGSHSSKSSKRSSSERDKEQSDSKVQVISHDRYKKDHCFYKRKYDNRVNYQNRSYYQQSGNVPPHLLPSYYSNSGQTYVAGYQNENFPYKRPRSPNSSPRRKDKDGSKFADLPKEIVLNSTYEEYLAATQALKQQQMYTMQSASFGVYDQYYSNVPYSYGMNQQMVMNQQFTAYNQNEFRNSANPSKYDQDVEEFLRKTSAPVASEKKEMPEEELKKKEKKKESRRRRSRSKSRDKSYRRKSKSRSKERH